MNYFTPTAVRKKKFALLEQTLNKHEDIKREREYKICFKIVRLKNIERILC